MPAPRMRLFPSVTALVAVELASLASSASAWSFNIASTPRQCENFTVDITGTGGQAPYSLLIVPFGPTPLPNAIEARRITNVPFNSSTSVTFQLAFPENSQFVAVVSDKSGFGTGGTSAAVTVLGGQSGCFDATKDVAPSWVFHTQPDGVLTTCTATRIWWNNGDPKGTPNFQGIIPGGQSFSIPVGQTSTQPQTGVGFQWTPSVRIGTTLLLVAGDDSGFGVAGSNVYTMQQGSSSSCLNDTSPSSTPGSPAGGSYPTSTDGSGVNTGGGGNSTNVGAIVGGVIGGVAGALALALILLFFMRRKRFNNSTKERPVDLLQDNDNDNAVGDSRPPEYYRPEPFVLPDPTVISSSHHDGTSSPPPSSARGSADIRRQSYLSTSTSDAAGAAGNAYGGYLRVGTSSAPSTSTRKSPAPPSFRPVNIIQHDDAGPGEEPQQEPETIELPPAYTSVKRNLDAPPPPEDEADEAPAAGGSVNVVGPSATNSS